MCYIVLKSLLNKKFNKEVSGVQLVWQTLVSFQFQDF